VGWTFVYLMLILKLPIAGLLYLVWWAIHQSDEPTQNGDEGGGSKVPRRPHPHPRLPRHPRRGPHGGDAVPAPARTRHVVAARSRLVKR
jgi:hypothetical protein